MAQNVQLWATQFQPASVYNPGNTGADLYWNLLTLAARRPSLIRMMQSGFKRHLQLKQQEKINKEWRGFVDEKGDDFVTWGKNQDQLIEGGPWDAQNINNSWESYKRIKAYQQALKGNLGRAFQFGTDGYANVSVSTAYGMGGKKVRRSRKIGKRRRRR